MDRLERAAAAAIAIAVIGVAVFVVLMLADSGDGDRPAPQAVAGVEGAPEGGGDGFFDGVGPTPTFEPAETATAETPTPEAREPARISWQGREVYLHGVNLPWYNWGCDFGCGSKDGASGPQVQAELREGFARLQEADIHVVRWWTFPGDPWQIETDADGLPTGVNPAVFADFDAALALAEEYDLYYVFTLFSSPTRMPEAWQQYPDRLAAALAELFSRYADNPRVMTWQVFNEPEWSIWNGEVAKKPVQDIVKAVAASVHESSGAYVSVGSAHIDGLSMWTGLGLDYYTAHWYDGMRDGRSCAMCSDYWRVKARHNLDAPLVIGEFFAGDSVEAGERYRQWFEKGYAGALAWSLFTDRTSDGMTVDLAAAAEFASAQAGLAP